MRATASPCARRSLHAGAALALLAAASPARAVESGLSPYAKGLLGFGSGIIPPQQGLYLSNIYYYFDGTAGTEVRNGAVELGVHVTENADMLEGLYVTDLHILGGQYAFGGLVPYAWADLKATVSTPLGGRQVSISNADIGDSLIIPLALGWHDGNLHWNFSALVYAPTGFYSTHALSTGKNIWGFLPELAMTYLDPDTGLDVSGALTYVTLTKNTATDYQSGDLLHLDWAIGLHLNEAFEIGAAGNVVQQIGADRGTGARLGPFKAQSIGIGLAGTYSTAIGHTPFIVGVKWEHDVDAHNTFEGDVVTAQATVVL